MQTIAIQTAQNIDIDYEVAGLGERVLARVIDYALYFVVFLLYSLIHVRSHSVLWSFTVPQIVFFIFYGFYDLVTEMLFNGQSLGKYIMKIRVISLDGSRPKVSQYLLRYIFRSVDFLFTLQVGAILSVALTENKQRIGDIVANTTLVKTKPHIEFEELDTVDIEDTYVPLFTEAINLSDKDIALIHEVINHFYTTGDTAFVDNMAAKVKTYLQINIPDDLNNYKFLKTILKDYSYLSLNMNPRLV